MRRMTKVMAGFSTATLMAALMFTVAPSPAQAGGAGDDHAAIRTAYDKMCAVCHAKDGSASTPTGKKMNVRPFTHPEVKKMTDAELTAAIAKGKGKMPGYEKKLTSAQIAQMVKLTRSMGN